MSLAFFRRVPMMRATLPSRLELAGRSVPLVVATSPRARRLTLRADPATACVRLTLPRGVSATKALAFVTEQQAWLADRIVRWPLPQPIVPGMLLPFGDGALRIDWTPAKARAPLRHEAVLCVGGSLESLAGRVERWMRAEARSALIADSTEFAALIDLPPPPVRVGDPRGRWGSCSAHGGLAYSWRLIMAPVFVRRAVAAHEVAHLVHHHHGPAFHSLANHLSGGTAKASSRWLAASGAALHWVGRG